MREAQKLTVIAPYYNEERVLDEKAKRLGDILKILIYILTMEMKI